MGIETVRARILEAPPQLSSVAAAGTKAIVLFYRRQSVSSNDTLSGFALASHRCSPRWRLLDLGRLSSRSRFACGLGRRSAQRAAVSRLTGSTDQAAAISGFRGRICRLLLQGAAVERRMRRALGDRSGAWPGFSQRRLLSLRILDPRSTPARGRGSGLLASSSATVHGGSQQNRTL